MWAGEAGVRDGELGALEREVEMARSRLTSDLAQLRSPENFSELKHKLSSEVQRTKDQAIARAKDVARDKAQNVLSDIKARVAANPVAALAIGAGVAWRLGHHPPVASALVGLGLIGLLRTDPRHPSMGSEMAARAVDLAASANRKMEGWRPSNPAGQMGEMAAAAKEHLGAFADTAQERISEWGSDAGDLAARTTSDVADAALSLTEKGTKVISAQVRDAEQRDRVLLGTAALALAAAVGIAAQRRLA